MASLTYAPKGLIRGLSASSSNKAFEVPLASKQWSQCGLMSHIRFSNCVMHVLYVCFVLSRTSLATFQLACCNGIASVINFPTVYWRTYIKQTSTPRRHVILTVAGINRDTSGEILAECSRQKKKILQAHTPRKKFIVN